mgnify:FL=1
MPMTCPKQAGIYHNTTATGKFAYILIEHSHPYSYYVMDGIPCDVHGNVQDGKEYAIPFAAEQFGNLVKTIDEEWYL